ncbi:hypothetical protein GCM10018953_16730 [Streptosporangium nondiastaticum]
MARPLGFTHKVAYERYARWRSGGKATLASKDAAGTGCKLTDDQLAWLKTLLEQGSLAQGWDDQHWTAARITTLIAETFHICYTARGGLPDAEARLELPGADPPRSAAR